MKPQAQKTSVQKLTFGAVLTALVILLQFMGTFIRFGPFSISLVLLPIVIGAATCGPYMGAWLGFVFGLVVLISGDASAFLAVNIPGTIITVLLKGTACGLCAGLIYKLFSKLNRYVGVAAAAIVCPLVNTGVFLLGCWLFFYDTVAGWAVGMGYGENVAAYMFLVLVGGNFVVELLINTLLSPVIVRLLGIQSKKPSGPAVPNDAE